MQNNKIILVNSRICPFAHRAHITARQKKIDFQVKQVSLRSKQEFFTETYRKAFAHDPNSTGKVPILIHGDRILAESDLITWYIAQTFETGTELIPKDTFVRAQARFFAHTYPSKLFNAFYSFMGYKHKSEEQKTKIKANVEKVFTLLNDKIVGPYAIGQQFTIADIMLWPWMDRWVAITHYFNEAVDPKYTKLHKWIQLMRNRESVKETTAPKQYFVKGYELYFG